jgi:hypothetical protein
LPGTVGLHRSKACVPSNPERLDAGFESVESEPPSPITGFPGNFSEVVPGIYRSSFPRPSNFEHLSTLGLRSIL